MAFVPGQAGKLAPETNLDFNDTRDGGVAAPSAGSYANHLDLIPNR